MVPITPMVTRDMTSSLHHVKPQSPPTLLVTPPTLVRTPPMVAARQTCHNSTLVATAQATLTLGFDTWARTTQELIQMSRRPQTPSPLATVATPTTCTTSRRDNRSQCSLPIPTLDRSSKLLTSRTTDLKCL